MNKILTEIIDLLETHRGLYENLLQLSLSKKDALVNGNVDEIDNIVSAEQILLIRIGEIESKRQKALRALANQINIDESKITFDYVLGLLGKAEGKKMLDIKSSLSNTIDDLNKYNQINTKLIETQLNYISLSFDLLTGVRQNTAYNSSGSLDRAKDTVALMDKKI